MEKQGKCLFCDNRTMMSDGMMCCTAPCEAVTVKRTLSPRVVGSYPERFNHLLINGKCHNWRARKYGDCTI